MVEELMTDLVKLVKRNGNIFENIRASVQPKFIYIDDTTLPIEEGDAIVRKLQNGRSERFIITDRGFYQGMHGVPGHYQIRFVTIP